MKGRMIIRILKAEGRKITKNKSKKIKRMKLLKRDLMTKGMKI